VTKPAWTAKATIIVSALPCLMAPLNIAWSQTELKQGKALPAGRRGVPSNVGQLSPSKAGQLKAGVRAGGAPGTALALKLSGEIAVADPATPKPPKRHVNAHTNVPKP
jgi:hypothetical protein